MRTLTAIAITCLLAACGGQVEDQGSADEEAAQSGELKVKCGTKTCPAGYICSDPDNNICERAAPSCPQHTCSPQ